MAGRSMHRDAITDVPGLLVGHWTNRRAATGCTVVLCPPEGAIAACASLGGAPGTRETDVLLPGNLVKRAHAILLTGGSVFGLDAATGVTRWLEEQGRGHKMRAVSVPIVPAAVLYDLGVGRADVRPDAAAGYAACVAAGAAVRQGSVGAGTGASVAKLAGIEHAVKGGLGTASEQSATGMVVGAIAAVNAVGEVIDPSDGRTVAGIRPRDGVVTDAVSLLRQRVPEPPPAGENTTIAVVATDLLLDREQLYRVALMAHAGLARTVRPSHTPADGDTIFALSTGTRVEAQPDLMAAGALAARALERAILNGVRHATTLAGIPAATEPVTVRPIIDDDRPLLAPLLAREWGGEVVVSRGVSHRPAELPGFIAEISGRLVGLVTVHVEGDACEVVTLNSLLPGRGHGQALLNTAERYAKDRGCCTLWLITTNDNSRALRLYQRWGMSIAAVRTGAIVAARAIKPEIPETGIDGIPIRDEIEMVKSL